MLFCFSYKPSVTPSQPRTKNSNTKRWTAKPATCTKPLTRSIFQNNEPHLGSEKPQSLSNGTEAVMCMETGETRLVEGNGTVVSNDCTIVATEAEEGKIQVDDPPDKASR